MPDEKSGKKPKDPVIYSLSKASRCYACDKKLQAGSFVKIEKSKDEKEVLCSVCAGLEDFRFIKAGNPKLTRLATKYSEVRFVVMLWSDMWKTYERQGMLVERAALERAETEAGKDS